MTILTVFTGAADAAQRAVDDWINSPGRVRTMIDPRCDCIGAGVTQCDGIVYCRMFVGIPNSVNFYAQPNMKQSGAFRAVECTAFLPIGGKYPVKYGVSANDEIASSPLRHGQLL
nr:CAP domain-containing protein [uncultured Oscillibacter sp.]